MSKKSLSPAGYVVIAAMAAVLYGPGIAGPYFADDFQLVFEHPAAQAAGCLARIYLPNTFYRPIQTCFLLHVQSAVGLDTLPIHVVHILLHALCSCLVGWAVLRLTSRPWSALVAGLAMAAGQANVLAVQNNDTLSQLAGTAFGVAALVAIGSRDVASIGWRSARNWGLSLAAIVLLALSLLSKESSICFPLIAVGVVALDPARGLPWWRRAMRVVAFALPILLVTLGYLSVRDHLHAWPASFGEGMYSFRFGGNLPRNVAILWTSALLPVSSVALFDAYSLREFGRLGCYAAASAVWLGMVGWGIVRGPHRRLAFWLGAGATIAMFPMAAMNHVSELYTYNAMPFVAAVLGIGFGPWMDIGRLPGSRRRVVVAVGMAILLSQSYATVTKVNMMNDNGRRAWQLLPAIVDVAKTAPSGGTIALVNPSGIGPSYSAFRLYAFDVISDAAGWIRVAARRPDLAVTVVDWENCPPPGPEVRRLTLSGDHVVAMAER
ncbi:MAG: hypothetical protein WCP29_00545 [Acidobacteriota bacterium]